MASQRITERTLARLAVDAALLIDPDRWIQISLPKAERYPHEFIEFVIANWGISPVEDSP